MKQYHGGDWGKPLEVMHSQAAAEAEISKRLAALKDMPARLGRMEIVSIDPSNASLTTAEAPGQSLESQILKGNRRLHRGGCTRALLLAGRWQAKLQTLDTAGFQPVLAETEPFEMLEYCDIRLKTLLELKPAWPSPRDRDRVLVWLGKQMQASSFDQQRQVWCHGDFGPTNLLWDGFTLTPIDYATCCLNYPLVDVTYLIHRLEMYGWQFPWRAFPLQAWRAACLRGYGMPDAEQLPIYRALMVRHMLCRLQTILYFPPRNRKQHWHNIWVCQRLTARIEQLLTQPCV
ncbi:MAG: phosphotransferase [Planctomycetales bacterium]|nr:phosphotransferase [Planctomycetales bacterium]